jgi:AraC family transcriptional regulator, transcriptional activator of pobA
LLRFYDRQFITRDNPHKGILERFENLLCDYYLSDKAQTIGLPSVAYSASELNLSANYFGDLVKKETGKSAQEYIQSKIIDVAKEKISIDSKTVSEIAYELGSNILSISAGYLNNLSGTHPMSTGCLTKG